MTLISPIYNLSPKKSKTKKSTPGISLKKICNMARDIGLPGNTKIHAVAQAYSDRFGLNKIIKNNKQGRALLLEISQQNIDLTGVVKFVPKKRGNRYVPADNKRVSNITSSSYEFIISNEFLASYEWRSLRMKALKMYGRKCACCGATPESGAIMNVDHIKPRRKYPELALELDNLQVLCEECNHGKGNWDETDWRDKKIV